MLQQMPKNDLQDTDFYRKKAATMSEKNTEVIFEFLHQGNAIRASAFDVGRMIEAVIIVPVNTPHSYIKLLLLQKLKRAVS